MMENLVDTAWLAAELGKPDLVVFDATKYLPNEDRDGRTEFRRSRIPEARFFDIDEAADPDAELPHTVPSPARFAKLAGALGVSNRSRVVFYDQKGLASAARGWWMLRLFGHDAVAVLDGGLPKWVREGRPVDSGEPPSPTASVFRPDYRSTFLRGIGDVLRAIDDGGELIVDARAAGRFDGTVQEPRPGMRSGHMPGARNVPYTELLGADQTFLPPSVLRDRFGAAGVDGTRPVVTTCGSGVTACILSLGMALAGLPPGAVYDGSWTEWAGRDDTAVVR